MICLYFKFNKINNNLLTLNMGCKESKQGGGGVEAVATGALDLSGMDKVQRFEHVLPFSKTKIDILE